MSVDNNHTTSTTHDDRLAVRLGLGAVLLWSTVATAFSLSLEYWTPLQLVTIAASVSWCLFAFRLASSTRRAALHATLFKDRLAALAPLALRRRSARGARRVRRPRRQRSDRDGSGASSSYRCTQYNHEGRLTWVGHSRNSDWS